MTRNSPLAAFALLALLTVTPLVQAQTAAPNAAAAARLAKLKARQDAIIAAAKANAAAASAKPVVAPPTATTPPPKATTTAPAASASAKPATSASAKPAASAPPATSGSAAPTAALPTHTDTAAIALDLDALKKTRPDRRHAEFLDLQARFGNLLSDPRANAELKLHAQRIAYLQRVRALGAKANDANFVKGVDALITTEETRDANALNAFRTGALPVPAAAPAATAVAVPVAAAAAGGGSK